MAGFRERRPNLLAGILGAGSEVHAPVERGLHLLAQVEPVRVGVLGESSPQPVSRGGGNPVDEQDDFPSRLLVHAKTLARFTEEGGRSTSAFGGARRHARWEPGTADESGEVECGRGAEGVATSPEGVAARPVVYPPDGFQ